MFSDEPPVSCKKPLILRRNLIVFFAVASAFIMCFLRYNLSVAIVAILDDHEQINRNGTVQTRKKYQFDEQEVGQLLAAYFYGYTFFQFPAGRLGELFGVKHILGCSTLVAGLLSFVTPIMLDLGALPMIVTRTMIGVLHCTVLSCSYTLFNEWISDNNKRSNAITLVNAGFELGGMCSFYLTGLISSSSPSAWRYSFYFFSLTAFVWFVPYCFFVSSKPEDDPNLSDFERNLIRQERKIKYQKQLSSILSTSALIKVPPKLNYRQILTSEVVWASCIAKSACALTYILIMVKMPAYLHTVFSVSLTENGLFTALTSAGIMTSKFLCFQLSSYVLGIERFSLTAKRKFFQTIAMLTPAVCLVILVMKNDSKELCIFLLVISMFGNGFVCLGDAPMTAEWAKDLSGSLYGFTNTFACLSAIFGPIMCSFVLKHYEDDLFLGWNIIFLIAASFLIVALIIFLLFATSEPCSWAESRFVSVDQFNMEKKNKSAKLV